MRRSLYSCAILLLCQAGLPAQTPSCQDDLRNWQQLGLPLVADWNCSVSAVGAGYTPSWHIDQVRKGHRFLPSIRVPLADPNANKARYVEAALAIPAADLDFVNTNHLPICLRTTDIANAFTSPIHRLPEVLSSIPLSPLAWRYEKNVLNDVPVADVFAPSPLWTQEGNLWGSSLFMKQLQKMIPAPEYIVFVENNESAVDDLNRYHAPTPSGTDSLGYKKFDWASDAVLGTLSIRMRDRVRELKAVDPASSFSDFLPEYWARQREHYQALYTAFDAALIRAWRARTYTVAYGGEDCRFAGPARNFEALGYEPEFTCRDACSPSYYIAGTYADFTSTDHAAVLNFIPAWEEARRRNPKAYRELSVLITDTACYAGAQARMHEVMTPSRYEGHIQWLLWSIHDPGVPVLLRHFSNSTTLPSTPMFDAAEQKTLKGLGADGLSIIAAKNVDYVNPIMCAVDRVCTNPTLRKFWLDGKPVIVPGLGHPSSQFSTLAPYPQPGSPDNRWRVLEVSTNPARSTWQSRRGIIDAKLKVWAVATQLDNEILLYLWTPCKLTGNVTVTVPGYGDAVVAAPAPWGYWLLKENVTPVKVLP